VCSFQFFANFVSLAVYTLHRGRIVILYLKIFGFCPRRLQKALLTERAVAWLCCKGSRNAYSAIIGATCCRGQRPSPRIMPLGWYTYILTLRHIQSYVIHDHVWCAPGLLCAAWTFAGRLAVQLQHDAWRTEVVSQIKSRGNIVTRTAAAASRARHKQMGMWLAKERFEMDTPGIILAAAGVNVPSY